MIMLLNIPGYSFDVSIEEVLKKVRTQLVNGKLNIILPKGDELTVTCPFHKDGLEQHPSCSIYVGEKENSKLVYGTFHCFTCGESGSFLKFLAACFNKDEVYASDWLLNNFDSERVDFESGSVLSLPEIEEAKPAIKQTPSVALQQYLLEGGLQTWHPYLEKRKLSQEVCRKFNVVFDPKDKCIVFPVWDANGNLCMITKRSVLSKQFYIEKDVEKPVYLLNYILQNSINTVFVCESQINALTLWSWGIPAVATFGCNITAKQFRLFNTSPIIHYFLAFDGDAAGVHGTRLFIKNIREDVFVDVISIPKGKDVNDLTKEECEKLEIVDSVTWLAKNKE